jgi:hypothetical protein
MIAIAMMCSVKQRLTVKKIRLGGVVDTLPYVDEYSRGIVLHDQNYFSEARTSRT